MINKNSRDFRINRRLKNKETTSKYKKFKILKKDSKEFRINKRLQKEKTLKDRKKRTIKRDNQDSKSNERMNLFFLEPFFCL